MSKHPPATDATPEALARALVRHGTSSNGRESGRTALGAEPTPEQQTPAPETRVDMSGSSSEERLSPTEQRRRVEKFLEPQMPPEFRRELMAEMNFGDEETQ